uniref:CpaF family protein n=1 Tax=Burkholderia arboris TaxID=488730 RepID=UPI003BEEDD9F
MLTLHNSQHDQKVFCAHLAPIAPLLDDPAVIEIMINGPDTVFAERLGSVEKVPVKLAAANISGAYKALASINDQDHHPILDCRMPQLRVAMALTPIAVHGPAMAIRKHRTSARKLQQYLEEGLFEPGQPRVRRIVARGDTPDISGGGQALYDFLVWLVQSRMNYLLAGSTSAGKTTFLNALISMIPDLERLIVIEDTTELIVSLSNYLQLEANPDIGVSIAALVRLALRMRPDRICIGEVRGATAYDLMDALNTGHPGSAATLHADSPEQALPRLESMIRQAPQAANWPLAAMRAQIASTFRYVIFASKEAGRAPESIVEILGVDDRGEYRFKPLYSRFADNDAAFSIAMP